jgi:hypothetical protein
MQFCTMIEEGVQSCHAIQEVHIASCKKHKVQIASTERDARFSLDQFNFYGC